MVYGSVRKYNRTHAGIGITIIRARFPKYLWVRTSLGKIKIRQSDILYIEADNVYSKIICKSRTFMERITLKEVEELLEPYFIRVHRSFIVNRNRIDSFKSNELRIGNHKIPVSKKYQDANRVHTSLVSVNLRHLLEKE